MAIVHWYERCTVHWIDSVAIGGFQVKLKKSLGGWGVPGRWGRIFRLGGLRGSKVGEEVGECGKGLRGHHLIVLTGTFCMGARTIYMKYAKYTKYSKYGNIGML